MVDGTKEERRVDQGVRGKLSQKLKPTVRNLYMRVMKWSETRKNGSGEGGTHYLENWLLSVVIAAEKITNTKPPKKEKPRCFKSGCRRREITVDGLSDDLRREREI